MTDNPQTANLIFRGVIGLGQILLGIYLMSGAGHMPFILILGIVLIAFGTSHLFHIASLVWVWWQSRDL